MRKIQSTVQILHFHVCCVVPQSPSLWETVLSERGCCTRHQWRAAPVQSWMDNSRSCSALGSCLWKEFHAAGITHRSCSHGGLLSWWNGSIRVGKSQMWWTFCIARYDRIHGTLKMNYILRHINIFSFSAVCVQTDIILKTQTIINAETQKTKMQNWCVFTWNVVVQTTKQYVLGVGTHQWVFIRLHVELRTNMMIVTPRHVQAGRP